MKFEKSDLNKLTFGLLIAITAVVLFNSYQLSQLIGNGNGGVPSPTGAVSLNSVIPTGVPDIYGEELGVSYDDVSASNQRQADVTIRNLGVLDREIDLSGDDLERYIRVVSKISCEYCCGAESIIFSNGQAACGCAHSYAMRGLAKYLITNHGDEVSDDEILTELAKWKTLFFPSQMSVKAQVLEDNGIEFSYINLGSNAYRGIESGAAGSGMVGGC